MLSWVAVYRKQKKYKEYHNDENVIIFINWTFYHFFFFLFFGWNKNTRLAYFRLRKGISKHQQVKK